MKIAIRILVVITIIGAAFGVWSQKQAEKWNAEGVRLLEAGKDAEALSVLQRAAARSQNPRVLKNLALAYERTGKSDQALKAVNQALAKQPDLAEAREMSQRLDKVVHQSDYLRKSADNRIARLKQAGRQPDSTDMKTVDAVVESLTALDDFERAVYVLEAALLNYPENLDIERRIQELEEKRDRAKSKTPSPGAQ